MKSVKLGSGSIDPYNDDFFRKIIEERKGKDKTDPLYYFLKILANAGCYGIYAEVNRFPSWEEQGTRKSKCSLAKIGQNEPARSKAGPLVFSACVGPDSSGREFVSAMLERLVTDEGGTYLMCDTDSMAIVSSEDGGLVDCTGGPHRTPDGKDAIKALPWKKVRTLVDRFEPLNPYNKIVFRARF